MAVRSGSPSAGERCCSGPEVPERKGTNGEACLPIHPTNYYQNFANFVSEFSEGRAARGRCIESSMVPSFTRGRLWVRRKKMETHLAQLDYKGSQSERRKGAKEVWS